MAIRLLELIAEASQNAAKLPLALITCGVALAAASLALLIFTVPPGKLLRLHGSAPALVFYVGLVAIAIYGLVQASVGYWMRRPRDDRRNVVGKVLLWFSLLPLALVLALGGAAVPLKY